MACGALIPALPDLAAEGASRDEAVRNAQRAAEDYLSKVEVTTIEINPAPRQVRADSAEALLSRAGMFKGDEEAMHEHISFATSQTKQIAALERSVFSGLSVSSDGRRILWSQVDRSESDIMLMENFR